MSSEWLDRVPDSAEVARWLALNREGHPPRWTLRLAHGLTEFLSSLADREGPPRLSLSFENVHEADPHDQEFLAVLLRRADPARLSVRIGSASENLDEALVAALRAHASKTIVQAPPDRAGRAPTFGARQGSPAGGRHALAREYVASDCTSDRPDLLEAYASLADEERIELHRRRAAWLVESSPQSHRLGAIPLHHERGCGDAGALLAASRICLELGYYEASLDWATRGRRLLPPGKRGKRWVDLSRNVLFSLLLLRRIDRVEEVCREHLDEGEEPELLAHVAYAQAILHARLHDHSRRDPEAARVWVERALAWSDRLPPSTARSVNAAFLKNTMALVMMRQRRFDRALELLAEAMEEVVAAAPEGFDVERVLLHHNRARLHVALGRPDAAIEDLTALLRLHPGDAAAYFDRGVLHEREGRAGDALADYDSAIRWSPPWPEPHIARARVLASSGRPDDALVEYAYALELAPGNVDALNDRACLLLHRRDPAGARVDVEAGLALAPKHAKLLCLRGLLETAAGRADRAFETFTAAIDADPSLADAWANRATVRFERGDLDGAEADLSTSLTLRDDPDARYNRGRVREAQGRLHEAVEDYAQVAETRGDADALRRLERCRRKGKSGRT